MKTYFWLKCSYLHAHFTLLFSKSKNSTFFSCVLQFVIIKSIFCSTSFRKIYFIPLCIGTAKRISLKFEIDYCRKRNVEMTFHSFANLYVILNCLSNSSKPFPSIFLLCECFLTACENSLARLFACEAFNFRTNFDNIISKAGGGGDSGEMFIRVNRKQNK